MIVSLTNQATTKAVEPDAAAPLAARPGYVILSFDVEEHHRIEAAKDLTLPPSVQARYRKRLAPPTLWLLEQLEQFAIKATFFVVGQIAEYKPELVRAIHEAGHEVASHGWDHRPAHCFTPTTFREDVRRSKETLEQVIGAGVSGFRAPTFSITRQTAWAIDVLNELGMRYDSSIYPVRHDRYGIPGAPRTLFRIVRGSCSLLEIPPATLRVLGTNLPVGGGGYFRLLPLFLLKHALRHAAASGQANASMLYFHPWEFDPQQPRLPLRLLNRFRTYVGIHGNRTRLARLFKWGERYSFIRAIDAAELLYQQPLPTFRLPA